MFVVLVGALRRAAFFWGVRRIEGGVLRGLGIGGVDAALFDALKGFDRQGGGGKHLDVGVSLAAYPNLRFAFFPVESLSVSTSVVRNVAVFKYPHGCRTPA
ncbi:hypothetical protein [Tahibacter aquaticus]|uniref:hypothetical protein n=1 Tax=Tahibacter aquaticus TaxID=520092 RepID=UPI00105DAF48|nr:hypothetical protein [Tahibacter aquaticus]